MLRGERSAEKLVVDCFRRILSGQSRVVDDVAFECFVEIGEVEPELLDHLRLREATGGTTLGSFYRDGQRGAQDRVCDSEAFTDKGLAER